MHYMSYEYSINKNGFITESSSTFKQKDVALFKDDSAFLNKMFHYTGYSHYGVGHVVELQRQYGTDLVVKLLNTVFNTRDMLTESLNTYKEEIDAMKKKLQNNNAEMADLKNDADKIIKDGLVWVEMKGMKNE